MSSFLQRLALRESGAAAVLAPRVTGWFESPAPIAPGLLPSAELERAAPAATAPLPAARPAAPARAAAAPDLAPARPAPTLPAPAAPPAHAPRHSAVAQPAALTRTIAAAAPLASPVQPPDALPPAAADAPAPPMLARPPEPPAKSASNPATQPAISPALTAMPVRSAHLAQAAMQVTQAGAGRRAAPDAQPQPVIQVTIGRLEVRAVQAPPTPAAPRPRQSPTSLDDYLARRNGAGRR